MTRKLTTNTTQSSAVSTPLPAVNNSRTGDFATTWVSWVNLTEPVRSTRGSIAETIRATPS